MSEGEGTPGHLPYRNEEWLRINTNCPSISSWCAAREIKSTYTIMPSDGYMWNEAAFISSSIGGNSRLSSRDSLQSSVSFQRETRGIWRLSPSLIALISLSIAADYSQIDDDHGIIAEAKLSFKMVKVMPSCSSLVMRMKIFTRRSAYSSALIYCSWHEALWWLLRIIDVSEKLVNRSLFTRACFWPISV